MKPTEDTIALHETAAEWLLSRRDKAYWTEADEHDFSTWLEADPRHRNVYARLERTWRDFSDVARPRLACDATTIQQRTGKSAGTAGVESLRDASDSGAARCRPRPWWSHRWVSTAAAVCLLVAVGGWFVYENIPTYQTTVATGHGQTHTLDLPDGTHIAVNMDSTLSVAFYSRRREVILDQGEAFFQVAHAAERPFTVTSGKSEVRVVGTVFDVDAAPPRLVVKVREGRVEFRPDSDVRDEVTVLSANQGVVLGTQQGGYKRFTAETNTVGDWRTGHLAFRRAPLGQVARDLARYVGHPVTLSDARLEPLLVSGYATTSAPDVFLESLPDLIAVRVKRQPDGSYQITER